MMRDCRVASSALARAEYAAPDCYPASRVIAHLDIAKPDASAGAHDPGRRGQIGIERRPQVIHPQVDGRYAPSEFGGEACMARNVDQSGNDAAVIIPRIGRSAELRAIGQGQRQRSLLDVDGDQLRRKPLVQWRLREQRLRECFGGRFVVICHELGPAYIQESELAPNG